MCIRDSSGKAVVIDDQYVYQLLTQHGCDGGNDRLNDNQLSLIHI